MTAHHEFCDGWHYIGRQPNGDDSRPCRGECLCTIGTSTLGSQRVCVRCGLLCECYVCTHETELR